MSKYLPDEYFKKLKKNQLTDADKKELSDWMLNADQQEVDAVVVKISAYFEAQQDEDFIPLQLGQAIDHRIDTSEKYKVSALIRRSLTIAATITIVFFTYFALKHKPVASPVAKVSIPSKIIPGGDKAILTLSNGRSIILNASKNGILARQGKIKIIKADNTRLVYAAVQGATANDAISYNTISTPRGGQYQVELPDGTKVWLNSVSSLRYPVNFGKGDRQVVLTGEAYFEVAKDKLHPFKVTVNKMEVKVLGTHFNIMAYADEETSKTTLLEGSVQVTKGTSQRTIVPGEQAEVGHEIRIKKINTAEAVEWKNGNFCFSHEQLPVIMRKIARWYDVDIAYKGRPTNLNFVGTIPRSKNINEVLKYLELTGLVNFKISERRVVVMP